MNKLKVMLACLVFGALVISACASTPAEAPAAAEPAAAEPAAEAPAAEEPAAEAAPAAEATTDGEVPRNRTMVVADFGPNYSSPDMWSPYNLGGTHQNGVSLFHEPLVFADMLDGHQYPWLATSWEYNADATELVYNLRDGVTWSDGEPFTADDVAYTLNNLRDLGNDVRLGGIYEVFIKDVEAVDDLTVKITLALVIVSANLC